MAIVALCRYQSTALLVRAVICKTNLYSENLFADEQTFLDKVRIQKPSFALLTNEFVSVTDVFADIRQSSSDTRIVLCVLPDAPKPSTLWPLLADLDVYALCKLSELSDCLYTLTLGQFYTSSLLATHPAYLQRGPFPGWSELSPSECRVLELMAEGHNGPRIAKTLHTKLKTIENHKYKISQKLNVTGGPGSLVKFSLMNSEQILALLDGVYKR